MICLSLLVLLLQQPLDEGTFTIREDTVELARESFELTEARLTGGETGWRLAAAARYDRMRPIITLAPTIELRSDSTPYGLTFDVADPNQPLRIRGQFTRSRLTVRFLGHRTESAREFAIRGKTVMLDDSVFAPFTFAVWVAGRADTATLTAIFPRAARRETLHFTDYGVSGALRHITLAGGANQLVHLWLDESGRLMKVEIPSRRIHVERVPPA